MTTYSSYIVTPEVDQKVRAVTSAVMNLVSLGDVNTDWSSASGMRKRKEILDRLSLMFNRFDPGMRLMLDEALHPLVPEGLRPENRSPNSPYDAVVYTEGQYQIASNIAANIAGFFQGADPSVMAMLLARTLGPVPRRILADALAQQMSRTEPDVPDAKAADMASVLGGLREIFQREAVYHEERASDNRRSLFPTALTREFYHGNQCDMMDRLSEAIGKLLESPG